MEVYTILLSSINDSNSIYEANYKEEKKCLSARDIVLLNSDLQIHLKEEFEVTDDLTSDMLASYIMNLEIGQILLFTRTQDYNVLSMMMIGKGFIVYLCLKEILDNLGNTPIN